MANYITKIGAYINENPLIKEEYGGRSLKKASCCLKARRVVVLAAALVGGFIAAPIVTAIGVVISPFKHCRNVVNSIRCYLNDENNSVIKKIAYLPYAIAKGVIQLPIHILISAVTLFLDSLLVGVRHLTGAKGWDLHAKYANFMAVNYDKNAV